MTIILTVLLSIASTPLPVLRVTGDVEVLARHYPGPACRHGYTMYRDRRDGSVWFVCEDRK